MSFLKDDLHRFAIGYLAVHEQAYLSQIVDAYISMHPDRAGTLSVRTLRSKLCRSVSQDIDYYGERADIQRTEFKTLKLREGFDWPRD